MNCNWLLLQITSKKPLLCGRAFFELSAFQYSIYFTTAAVCPL